MSSKFLVFRKPEKHQTVMKARSGLTCDQASLLFLSGRPDPTKTKGTPDRRLVRVKIILLVLLML